MEQLRGELDEMKEHMGFVVLDMQDLVCGQELLKEENTQLKTQLNLVMEILGTMLKKEDVSMPATIRDTIPPHNLGTLLGQGVSPPQPCIPGSSHPQPIVTSREDPKGKVRQQRPKQPERKFDPIPMLYAQLLPPLLELHLVKLRIFTTHEKRPHGFDDNARCDFHSRTPGHDIEDCVAFKHQVQDLLDAGTILFTPEGLSVKINLMPTTTKISATPSLLQSSISRLESHHP